MANVLLIYPDWRVVTPLFPYSLLPNAAALLQGGHQVRVFDARVEDLSEVDPRKFDIFGISTISGYQVAGGLKAAGYLRERAPNNPIVWGGVHPSSAPEETIRHPLVDIVVRGEGERTFPNLIDALDRGAALREVTGLTLMEDGEVVSTGDTPFIDLDKSPFLPYHLVKMKLYPHFTEKPSRAFYESSRGCSNNCGFCYNRAVHKRKWRSKSASRVLDELEYIMDLLKPDMICQMDDNFSVSKKRVYEIARGMIERGIRCEWPMYARFDHAVNYDSEFLNTLKESGCTSMSLGGESGSQRILDWMCKGITPDMMRETAALLKKHEIGCGVMFMAGFPDETDGELKATLDLIDELVAIYPKLEPKLTVYTPFPGTALYQDAIAHGFKEPGSLEAWGNYRYGVVDNCPWLKGRRRSTVRTVCFLSVTDFTKQGLKSPRFRDKRLWYLGHRALSVSARWRWKHKFFRFGYEFRLLDVVLKKMRLIT